MAFVDCLVPVSTSSAQAARTRTRVVLHQGIGGLTFDSVAVCHQVTTLDREKLLHRMGELDEDLMLKIAIGLKAAIDID